MARMGRPKSENPKSTQLSVRLDQGTLEKLDRCADHYKEIRSIYCDLDSAVKTLGVLEEMLSETSPPNRYADILYIVCMCMEQISGRVSDYIHTCEQRDI